MFVHHSNHVNVGCFQQTSLKEVSTHFFQDKESFKFYTFSFLKRLPNINEEMVHLKHNFYIPPRIMDSKAIYVVDLLADPTYADIKDTFCPFQRTPPRQITKHRHYVILNLKRQRPQEKYYKRKMK